MRCVSMISIKFHEQAFQNKIWRQQRQWQRQRQSVESLLIVSVGASSDHGVQKEKTLSHYKYFMALCFLHPHKVFVHRSRLYAS